MPHFLADHSPAFVAKNSFAPNARVFFDNLGTSVSHMRVGAFDVVIAEDIDLWAAVTQTEDLSYSRQEFSTDAGYDRYRTDRLSQLARVEAAIKDSHPHAAALRTAIAAERAF